MRESGQNLSRIPTELIYGENPWQKAAFVKESDDPLGIPSFSLVSGDTPSYNNIGYNNIADLDRLLQTITHIAAAFDINRGKVPLIAVAVKHGNPCGASIGYDPLYVIRRMIVGDPRAFFGGSVMTNFAIGEKHAKTLLSYGVPDEGRRILSVVAAPAFYTPKAVELLSRKNGACLVFINNALISALDKNCLDTEPRTRSVRGGKIIQDNYTHILNLKDSTLQKLGVLSRSEEDDLLLAWAIGATSNSNTITIVRGGMLLGNGVGQQDRVSACALAVSKAIDAGHGAEGALAYSDSFFPFTDGPEVLREAGIKAVLASGGSVRDNEVLEYCEKNDLVLYLIPDKVARGFYMH